jgi:hypothetical protein
MNEPPLRSDSSDVTLLPFGAGTVERYLAIGCPEHLPETYLRTWLGEASPFLAYGRGEVAFAGDQGALVLTANPKVVGEPFAAFGGLTFRPGLAPEVRDAVAASLLAAARQWGAEQGLVTLRGPLLFSTWHPYRVADPDSEQKRPPFPGERVEPAEMQRYYQAAGMDGSVGYLTTYRGDIIADIEPYREDIDQLPLRHLGADYIAAHLPTIHHLVTTVFSRNAYYAPIDVPEFGAVLALEPAGSQEFLGIGYFGQNDDLLGFAVGYGFVPEGAEAKDKLAILKTLGVHPDHRGGEVTWTVTMGFHAMIAAKGYDHVYHAMMKADNKSVKLSSQYAEPVRHYRLFAGPTGV